MPELTIERAVPGGDGLGRIDGAVCLVPYGLPGDRLEITDPQHRGGVLRAAAVQVVEASPHRVRAECPVFGVCGGCTWLHFAYPAQAEAKRAIVADCFRRIARREVAPGWIENTSLRMGYRTRATFRGRHGRYGFLEARSHTIADIAACPLCHPRLNEALAALRASGLEGEFEVTVNPEGEDTLVWTREHGQELRRLFPQTNTPEDRDTRHRFLFDGVPIVSGGFAQASLLLNRMLVNRVHEAIGAGESLLDLYCGSGNFSLALAKNRTVSGLDHNRAAIAAAQAIGAGQYGAGDEGAFVRAIGSRAWHAILLDPPREGAKAVIPALAGSRAEKVVYVSCDPATLARDARVMLDAGWALAALDAVDMFPQTPHVECVAVLVREVPH
jgi:23S rRNA (uracil1939-C5)-methyltransferase